jgi:hypothetical protein
MRSLVVCVRLALVPMLAVSACGDDGGGDAVDSAISVSDASPDAPATPDARPTFDATPPADARPAALGCLGDPIPNPTAATVTVSGDVVTISGGSQAAVEDALITGYGSDDQPLAGATDTSDAQGNWSITASVGNEPLDAYVRATHAEYMDTYLYPPTSLYEDLTGASVIMLNSGTLGLLELLGLSQDDDKGVLLVAVLDCDGNPVEGASVTTTPAAGQTAYLENGAPSTTATATDSSGAAMLFNVPAGDVEVDATVMGMSLRAHTVRVLTVAGDTENDPAISSTAIVP